MSRVHSLHHKNHGAGPILHQVESALASNSKEHRVPMLHGYADTDTGTRYGDTPIRHFSQNADTWIRQYILKIKNNKPIKIRN